MTIALGIDTGGTYTDAVLVDHETGSVLASAKSLTTYHDLAAGIRQALATLFVEAGGRRPADVGMVSLSTTLATNAIVEGRGSRVCLLLIGYDPTLLRQFDLERELVVEDVVHIAGGHDGFGDEVEPLDEDALRRAILDHRDRVEAFAISGYFAVRNPAHELRARALVQELTMRADGSALPVTCGHELTSRLNAVRRATTTALNARLIPLLQDLVADVRRALADLGIAAPLMVVKGDGSLARAEWAMQRPIETILSGPAASVVGAWHLAGRRDVWVVDVGGTTTDIACLVDGRPRLNPKGARVGRWRTMVEAADVHTAGLGGDSQVRLGNGASLPDGLEIGPRRVVPLCVLASRYPHVVEQLERQILDPPPRALAGQFVLGQRQAGLVLFDDDQALLDRLASGPQPLAALLPEGPRGFRMLRQIERLSAQRLLLVAGFTPTDALHVLGDMNHWPATASRLGAALLAGLAGLTSEAFCRRVVTGVSDRVALQLVSTALSREAEPDWEREPTARALLLRALNGNERHELGCRLILDQPIVAIGAPVAAYLPRTAQQLHAELVIPQHSEVANAVGAVAGSVIQQVRVLIHPLEGADAAFRAHLPDGMVDAESLEEAVAEATARVPEHLARLAAQAGASQVEIRSSRVDHIVPLQDEFGHVVYLRTDLTFTAVGRPNLTQPL